MIEGSTLNEEDFIYDSSNTRRYRAVCNGCGKDRGYVRKTTRNKMCMSCGQKGKVGGMKGKKHSPLTISKLQEEQTRRLSLKGLKKRTPEEKKIIHTLRTRLWQTLKGLNCSISSIELLGCSTEELIKHLEGQFEPWMNWGNYGRYDSLKMTWNIDHMIPLDYVDISNKEDLARICNYSNLRPLLCTTNSSKGNRL